MLYNSGMTNATTDATITAPTNAAATTSAAANATVDVLLNRRSIRQFLPDPIEEGTVARLEAAAQHAASSQYLNAWSAIRVTDDALKQAIAAIGHQDYIAQAPLLYIFIADLHRDTAIARREGVDTDAASFTLNTGYRYAQAQNDAVLALHAMETAANAMGLGCVILGSVLNDSRRLITLMKLPRYTVPVLGLAIGKPAQSPARKPRMPRSMQFFDNAYPATDDRMLAPLDDFDAEVHQYYDLRQADRPVAAFSAQVASVATARDPLRKAIGPIARQQGFDLDR